MLSFVNQFLLSPHSLIPNFMFHKTSLVTHLGQMREGLPQGA